MRLKGKNVLVVGLGRSGRAAARFLLDRGAHVAVTDQKSEEQLGNWRQGLEGKNLEIHLGRHDREVFEKRDLICLSPGVPPDLPGLKLARRRKTQVIGEMGLGAHFLEVPFVAVTGTNGKSTTSTLIHQMLLQSGQQAALGGNIGTPLLELIMSGGHYERYVLEVSSYQLETVDRFRPEVAVLLNVTEDHTDRYASFQDYVRTKIRILRDQTARDSVVYNAEDPHLMAYACRAHAKRIPFALHRQLPEGLFYSHGRIVRRCKREFEDYPVLKTKLVGLHNVENMMASVGAARSVGILPGQIQKVIESFEGLPHRMQQVGEYRGVRYYDDSKGTNVDSVCKSVGGFENRQVILIAGGRDKGGSYQPLKEILSQKVRSLLLIGEASSKMARKLQGSVAIEEAGTLDEAVRRAVQRAKKGQVVLFSPACSSFDQFRDYAERGEKFQELVRKHAQVV
ncbi:MAG: UDP-N-acetylmuramoyl-L-alanine--D-glutamate ligase [Deltaproteobacteria bacterium]|nr:UDP-N-acetylmuramoyl-L-alanine--D-glutamate ligase [Deltaproteobacteria bacterium]